VNVADASALATAGLQKRILTTLAGGSPIWILQYTIQSGLDLGVPCIVSNYPASIEPATGGCRNITGVVNWTGPRQFTRSRPQSAETATMAPIPTSSL